MKNSQSLQTNLQPKLLAVVAAIAIALGGVACSDKSETAKSETAKSADAAKTDTQPRLTKQAKLVQLRGSQSRINRDSGAAQQRQHGAQISRQWQCRRMARSQHWRRSQWFAFDAGVGQCG